MASDAEDEAITSVREQYFAFLFFREDQHDLPELLFYMNYISPANFGLVSFHCITEHEQKSGLLVSLVCGLGTFMTSVIVGQTE